MTIWGSNGEARPYHGLGGFGMRAALTVVWDEGGPCRPTAACAVFRFLAHVTHPRGPCVMPHPAGQVPARLFGSAQLPCQFTNSAAVPTDALPHRALTEHCFHSLRHAAAAPTHLPSAGIHAAGARMEYPWWGGASARQGRGSLHWRGPELYVCRLRFNEKLLSQALDMTPLLVR